MPMDSPDRAALYRKVAWRLVPFLTLLYFLNILDRANVGFAALRMQEDLRMDKEVYAFGGGIFYLGYLMFEVPANFLLRRVGARRWMARIMITWGLVSCSTAFVSGPIGFYAVRILLGVAEAGFFPGIILYLTYWFPARERVRIMALFMTAIPISGVIGHPISGAIMQYLAGVGGLLGWQWLFLLEGLPSVLVGFTVLFVLPDGPLQATWLTPYERAALMSELEGEERYREQHHESNWLRVFIDWRVWLLIAVYFTVALGLNGSGFTFPRLIKEQFPAQQEFGIGLLSALPSLCSAVGMLVIARNSDRTGERRGHVAFSGALGAAGWCLAYLGATGWESAGLPPSRGLFLVGLCLAQSGMMAMLATFWSLPTACLSGAAAAGGIAWINSVGNIGGLIAANVVSMYGPLAVAGILGVGVALTLCVRHDATLDKGLPTAPDESIRPASESLHPAR
jgi:MFS transporter, ACS family, tartrate transporter